MTHVKRRKNNGNPEIFSQNTKWTCSSLINSWSRCLSFWPWRPPLRGLMKTTKGVSGDGETIFCGGVVAEAPAMGSFKRIESRKAKRRYWGIITFVLSSCLSIRIPERPQPLSESMKEERAATVTSSPVSAPGPALEWSICGSLRSGEEWFSWG